MRAVDGYTIESPLHRGERTLVYEAIRDCDSERVIIKMPRAGGASDGDAARWRHEQSILEHLAGEGAPRAIALTRAGATPALVVSALEGAEPLAKLAGESVAFLLHVFLRVCETLQRVHGRGVVHKDVSPSNVLYSRARDEALLVDFELATFVAAESRDVEAAPHLAATLAYMAPEQTGRMNRHVDARSDFYALGATFYELFTGRAPFEAIDPIELVHAHIAIAPAPAHDVDARVPPGVSDVLAKLLAKTPDDRYQSLGGLLADLQRCARELDATGAVASFPLGTRDVPEQLRAPARFYGREKEIATLLGAFDRAAAGATELLLVSGPSGIGKTSLVRETKNKASERRGYFLSGKCDQFQRDVPLAPIIEAFRGLARQLVAEPPDRLEIWSARLRRALGANGAVLTAVVPELEWVIGAQKPVHELRALEAQHRFHDALERFLDVFARAEHPLVLFLDDLQWADAATMRLLRLWIGARRARHLFVVGSYRDGDVDDAHPLAVMRGELRREGIDVAEIALSSLHVDDVRDLIADALRAPPDEVRPLAEVVHAKTDGNPFFVIQFLGELQREGIARFDRAKGAWTWDLARARDRVGTDNVLDFLVRRIGARGDEAKRVLSLAACIGGVFDLAALAVACERPAEQVAASLWAAIEDGLVVPVGDGYAAFARAPASAAIDAGRDPSAARYRFAHDRVQQAAFAQIPESERRDVHLRIARLLVAAAKDRPLTRDELFVVAGHFEAALDAIVDPAERLAVARLQLDAGKRTKRSAAYEGAVRFLRNARALAGDGAWESDYPLAFEIHRELAECEWLAGHRDRSESLYEEAHARARSDVERAAIALLQVVQYTNDGKAEEAVRAGIRGLDRVGVRMPRRCSIALVAWALVRARLALAGGALERELRIDKARDPALDARLRIFVALAAPSYELADQNLYGFTILSAVHHAVRHGGSPDDVAFTVATYAALRTAIFVRYDEGKRLVEVARSVVDRAPDCTIRGRIEYLAHYFVLPWSAPLRASIAGLEAAATRCAEDGDITWAVYGLVNAGSYALFLGADLSAPLALRDRFDALLRKRDDVAMRFTNANLLKTCERLAGPDAAPLDILAPEFGDGEDITGSPAATGLTAAVGLLYKAKLVTLLGDPREALSWIERAGAQRPALVGTTYLAYIALYEALVMGELWPSASADERRRFRRVMARADRALATWAERVPETFGHLWSLVRAERARAAGDRDRAATAYDAAIAAARAARAPLYVGLASERAGTLWREAGRDAFARVYLADARDAYAAWGAARKARQVATRHADLLAAPRLGPGEPAGAPTSTAKALAADAHGTASLAELDVQAIFKAAEALTSEFAIDRLLDKMMRVVLEVAGARRGLLLVADGDAARARAVGTVEKDRIAVDVIPPKARGLAPPMASGVVQIAMRSREIVVIDDATKADTFRGDTYVRGAFPKSILCVPLVQRGKLAALLYLENALVAGAFTARLVEVLRLLASQLAICIENASLYEGLERRVADRTRQLEAANHRIRQLFDHMREGIVVFDERGRVEGDVSRRARAMFPGIAAGASVRAHLFPEEGDPGAVVFDEWLPEVFAAPLDVIDELTQLAPPEAVLRRGAPDETWLSLEFRAVVANERVARVMLLATDDTARRKIEREASARDREHAQQMAVMRRLVSGSAATFVSFLATSEQRLRRFDALLDAAPSLDRVRVEQLFQIAHTLRGEGRTFDLARVVTACSAIEDELAELRRGAPPEREATVARTLRDRVNDAREGLDQARRAFVAAAPGGASALDEASVDRKLLTRLLELVAGHDDELARVAARLASRPFGEIAARLAEDAPAWAQSAGKLVDVAVEGREVRVPPALAACLGGALGHLVRNALSHGIEAPDARRAKDKPPFGALRLACVDEPAGPVVIVEDDGAGIDFAALAAHAAAAGLRAPPGREVDLLFASGVTTAASPGELAGRGVGMAAVRSDVEEAGYAIDVTTTAGAGTRVTLRPRA